MEQTERGKAPVFALRPSAFRRATSSDRAYPQRESPSARPLAIDRSVVEGRDPAQRLQLLRQMARTPASLHSHHHFSGGYFGIPYVGNRRSLDDSTPR